MRGYNIHANCIRHHLIQHGEGGQQMLLIPGINLSVYAIPFWLAFIGLSYWLKTRAA